MLEAKANQLSVQMNHILESTPSMESITAYEYVELLQLTPSQVHVRTGYLPEYDGCVGYYYCSRCSIL